MNLKRKAISEFSKQKENIPLNSFYDSTWKAYTAELIKKYIGENSHFYTEFLTLEKDDTFKKVLRQSVGSVEFNKVINSKQKKFIESCIDYISANGIYRQYKSNFISRMSEGWAIFIAGLFLLTWGGIWYEIGKYQTQNKIDLDKISKQNKIDSLTRITQSLKMTANKAANNKATESINNKPQK